MIAGVLLVPAWLLLPLERQLHEQRRLLKYGGAPVSVEMRDRLGQGMAIGLLAGFRGLVADSLWIQNHGFFERREWLRMYRNMQLVTTLQPQSVTFWDVSQWHLAWNIAYAVRTDPANHSRAAGIKREQEWLERAVTFLEDGLRNIPNRYDLYFAMGWLCWQKLDDPCRAADWFQRASTFPDAPSYVGRMYPRTLERCGRAKDAYEYWKRLWRNGNPAPFRDGIDARTVIERELRRLEQELPVPNDQRVLPAPSAATMGK